MITKFKSLKKLKNFFKSDSAGGSSSVREGSEIGAIVYRKIKGSLYVLLLKDSQGCWSIPSTFQREDETSAQSVVRIIEENTGPIELKIWQTLGQISFADSQSSKKRLNNLQVFLIQALMDSDNRPANQEYKDMLWLPAKEALDKIDYDDVTKMIALAVAKIKRAQI